MRRAHHELPARSAALVACDDGPMGFTDRRLDPMSYADAGLTYAEVGATRGALPPGYRHIDRHDRIGAGRSAWSAATAAVTGWAMHRAAGLTVAASTGTAEVESLVVLRFGWPVIGLVTPCRVVYVVNEPSRRGFAYGTLPGHPESGEEAFMVELTGADDIELHIRAFSRPATWLARAGGPVTRSVQTMITRRYVRALRHLAR